MGRTIKHGEVDFTVSEKFYGKNPLEKERLRELLSEFGSINLLGKKSVSIALEENLISKKNIIEISGIPHAQIFRV